MASASSMPTRNQALAALTVVDAIPADIDPDCAICADALDQPVGLSCKHIFCRNCITNWFDSMNGRNTCPYCRKVLFRFCLADRGPIGPARLQLVAHALSRSGIAKGDFDFYGQAVTLTTLEVQKAASEAYRYLAAETHNEFEDMLVNMKDLGPHITAMGNFLRGYAAAAGRPYSARLRVVWKMVVEIAISLGIEADGSRDRLPAEVARHLKEIVKQTLIEADVDVSRTFFETNANMDSASGDLDVLLEYTTYQAAMTFARRQERQIEGPISWATNGLRRIGVALLRSAQDQS